MRKNSPLINQYIPVTSKNWDSSRKPIKKIIIHTMQGTLTGSTAWFSNPAATGLAHYGVGLNGRIVQWVTEDINAYHAGNYEINQESIGIEHEDGYNPQTNPDATNKPRADALYEASAPLIADICREYNIPIDEQHILRHRDVSKKSTACPGTLDIGRLIAMAKGVYQPPPVVPTPPSNPSVKTVTLKESEFLDLVIKSRNWDEVVNVVRPNLSNPNTFSPLDPKGYEPVALYIIELKNKIIRLESAGNEVKIDSKPVFAGETASGNKPILFEDLDILIQKGIQAIFKKKITNKT